MDKSLNLDLAGERFVFDCRRAIFWPRRRILLLSDLHWGKTQYLRSHGIAISDKVFDSDLERLGQIIDDYQVQTMLVLGDLVHHEKSLNKATVEKVIRFRESHPCELILVKGNHDRFTVFPDGWGIVEEQDLRLDGFYFSHEHNPKARAYQFSGHLHPMLRLRAGVDELRLPSFILREDACFLPAFSHLTGGQDVRLKKNHRAVVLMDDGLEIFEK